MDENDLVKEISPEEVRNIDPYEISYIAMKDGSIIMVLEKKIEIINQRIYYQTRESMEKELQKSPNFNLKESRYISCTNPKIEKEQKQYEEEEDFNVYYSNSNKKRESFQDKSYHLNMNNNNLLYEDINNHIKNDSFYSSDFINQPTYRTQKYIDINNNKNTEYKYDNNTVNNEEYQNNNFNRMTNNNINYINECTNFENQKPLFIVKKNYKYYKRTKYENSRKNKTYSNEKPKPYKKMDNFFIRENHNNISITQSKFSILSDNNDKNNNNNDKYINNYICKTPEPQKHKRIINSFSFKNNDTDKYSGDIIRERKLNKIKTTNNNVKNVNNVNNYNEMKIHKTNDNRKTINIKNIRKSGYSLDKNQSKYNYNTPNELILDNDNQNIRSKTPLYSIKNLRRNNHIKKNNNIRNNNTNNNNILRKCLTRDNHKYYERKDFSKPKKVVSSNYTKKKDLDGNIIHIFENK